LNCGGCSVKEGRKENAERIDCKKNGSGAREGNQKETRKVGEGEEQRTAHGVEGGKGAGVGAGTMYPKKVGSLEEKGFGVHRSKYGEKSLANP